MSSIELSQEEKFRALYNEQADGIFRHCYFRVSDREIALDLVQESFLKLWQFMNKEQGQEIENPKALIYKIAGNLVIDYYRKKKTISLEKVVEDNPAVLAYDNQVESMAEINILMQALEKLGPTYRTVFVARFIDGLSIAEIADKIGVSENLVSVKIHRARIDLKKILKIDI